MSTNSPPFGRRHIIEVPKYDTTVYVHVYYYGTCTLIVFYSINSHSDSTSPTRDCLVYM